MEATSLARIDTVYSADSIEFCPVPGYERWFTCGTYQLLVPGTGELAPPPPGYDNGADGETAQSVAKGTTASDVGDGNNSEQNAPVPSADACTDDTASDTSAPHEPEPTPEAPRIGRLYLYSVDGVAPVEAWRGETAAILDAKWARAGASDVPEVGVADAQGGLARYVLRLGDDGDGDAASALLEMVERVAVAPETTLALSLDWGYGARARETVVSLSSGELARVVPAESGSVVADRWAAHDYEPWICAWDGHDPAVVWSGGDDLALKRWDVRAPLTPTFVWRRADGGVTTIAPAPHVPHLLAVGSYDSQLRVFDVRAPRAPLCEVQMPGGVWRTRWHPSPSRPRDILNACMHGGFAVARLDDAAAKGEVVTTFPGTLAYGADWCRRQDDEGSLVATCSFYDHVMDVWRA